MVPIPIIRCHRLRVRPISVIRYRRISSSRVFKTPVLFVDNGSQNLEYTWCIFSEGCCNDSVVIHDCAISGNKTLKVLTTILKSMKTLIKCYSAEDLNHYHVISVHLGGEKVILCDVYNFATIFC